MMILLQRLQLPIFENGYIAEDFYKKDQRPGAVYQKFLAYLSKPANIYLYIR
jgi:hypothetical protein